jgi:hypothetical protein
MNPRLAALSICLAIMVAVLFFGIVPAVMPGRTLMAPYRRRLDQRRGDHGWKPVSVSQAVKLADGEFASGLLMMRTMEGEKQYRRMSVAEELLTRMEMGQDF